MSLIEIIKNKKEITAKNSLPKNEEKSFWNWLLPLILLGLIAWYLWKICEKQNTPETLKIEHRK